MLAYMHNYNIVYLVMFFTFSFAAASSLIGRLNLDALDARVLSQERLFAQNASACKVIVENHTSRVSYAIECTYAGQSRGIRRIDAYKGEIIDFDVRFDQRGEHDCLPLEIASYFPLPYERFFTFRGLHQKVMVYPEPKGVSLQEYYRQSLTLIGERDDFEGLRTYQHDDNVALIHWPSLASGAGVMSKQFSHTRQDTTLDLDFLSCASSDEARLSQLCLWVVTCEREHLSFTITMPVQLLDSKKMTTDAILAYLASY